MTNKEAIKEAKAQIGVYENMILYNKDFEPQNDNSNYEHKIEFLKLAIEALEKQTSQKPTRMYRDATCWKFWKCPSCGYILGYKYNYCYSCGQRLDWKQVE